MSAASKHLGHQPPDQSPSHPSLTHSFHKYVLRIAYMPGTLVGVRGKNKVTKQNRHNPFDKQNSPFP